MKLKSICVKQKESGVSLFSHFLNFPHCYHYDDDDDDDDYNERGKIIYFCHMLFPAFC